MIKSFTPFFNAIQKKVMIASFLLVVIATSAFSQARTVTGTVRASDTRETLPGTTVRVKDAATGTVTDIDGKYSIQVKAGKAVLIFSFVGYTPQEVEINTEKTIDVVLEPSKICLLYTSPSPRDRTRSRMPSSA